MDRKLSNAVANMMKLEEPPNLETLKKSRQMRWHLKALLAYKQMKDYSTGKTEREYNKKYREHYKELVNLFSSK